MNIGILRVHKPKSEHDPAITHRLIGAGRAHGHNMIEFYEPEITIQAHKNNFVILHQGVPFPKIDVIINRPGYIEEPSLHSITTELLVRAGYRVLNSAVSDTKNKLTQHIRLTQAGIAMPAWAIARTAERAINIAQDMGFPVMLKVAFGTHGKGVFIAKDKETLSPIVDYLAIRDGNPVIIETFIEEANHADIRVFVVGDQVIAAMERTAKTDDVRANASIGGLGSPVVLSTEEISLAKAATKTMGLDIAGVDLIRSHRGPLVLEVNANPGFEELERATSVDVAGAIIEFAARQK